MRISKLASHALIVGTAAAFLVASLGYLTLEGRREALAAYEIQQLGGQVYFAWRLDPAIQTTDTKGMKEWRKWLAYVVDGVDLAYSHSQIGDEDLAQLRPLRHLRWLRLCNSRTTDAGLEHLVELSGLKGLDLRNTQVTDVGVSRLCQLQHLEWLDLRDTQATDSALISLKELPRLRVINLQGTRMTQDAVAALRAQLPEARIQFEQQHQPPPVFTELPESKGIPAGVTGQEFLLGSEAQLTSKGNSP